MTAIPLSLTPLSFSMPLSGDTSALRMLTGCTNAHDFRGARPGTLVCKSVTLYARKPEYLAVLTFAETASGSLRASDYQAVIESAQQRVAGDETLDYLP